MLRVTDPGEGEGIVSFETRTFRKVCPTAALVLSSVASFGLASPCVAESTPILPNALKDTRFSLSGFIKLDTLLTKYGDGDLADPSPGRDFYVPSTIPVGGAKEGADFDSHIKQTRLIFGTDTDLEDGSKLLARVEVDFYGSSLGEERATNTYGVQVRHAYVQWKNWLAGQTWSNFQDAASLPETADFIGPTDGTVFVRQPMVRYTHGSWSVSLENPETTITPFQGGARIVSDDNSMPDVTGAYTFKITNGYVRVAGLARQLKYEVPGTVNDSTLTGAVSAAGKINFGKDDLRFAITAGDALGRYVGVNFNNDAVLSASGSLESVSGWAGYVSWRHVLNTKLRTNLMYSTSSYDNDTALTGLAANKSSSSLAANVFLSPVSKLDLGLEIRYAEREIESGNNGSMLRLQGIVKYSF